MKNRNIQKWLIPALALLVIAALFLLNRPELPQAEPDIRTAADLVNLKNTDLLPEETITHIFLGTVSEQGKASGYHYDGIEDSPGAIVEGTRSEPDQYGVYTAKVTVDGIGKSGNKGYSTFYPDDFTPQQVIDAINEAYENKVLLEGSLYAGLTENGIEIDMAIDESGKIITAYPVKEEDRR